MRRYRSPCQAVLTPAYECCRWTYLISVDMYLWACEEVVLWRASWAFGMNIVRKPLLFFFSPSLFLFSFTGDVLFSSISLTRPEAPASQGGSNPILCRGRAPGSRHKDLSAKPLPGLPPGSPGHPSPRPGKSCFPPKTLLRTLCSRPDLGRAVRLGCCPAPG